MRSPRIRRILGVFLASAWLAGCASTDGTMAGSNSAEDVRTLYLSGIEAFNAHDLERFMEQFAEDIRMYTPTGWLTGKAAVRDRFAQTFQQFPSVRMEIVDLQVRSVAADVAVVEFRWRVQPRGTGPAFEGVGSGVYVRREGRWIEVLEHETVVRTDPELQPPGNGDS